MPQQAALSPTYAGLYINLPYTVLITVVPLAELTTQFINSCIIPELNAKIDSSIQFRKQAMKLYKVTFEHTNYAETSIVTEGCDLKKFIEDNDEDALWVMVHYNEDLECDSEHELDWTSYDLNHLYSN